MLITRDQLITAIEHGIKCAGDRLDRTDAEALRKVGTTTTRCAYGGYRHQGVGCPAVQAGLNNSDGATWFVFGFDECIIIRTSAWRRTLGILDVMDKVPS